MQTALEEPEKTQEAKQTLCQRAASVLCLDNFSPYITSCNEGVSKKSSQRSTDRPYQEALISSTNLSHILDLSLVFDGKSNIQLLEFLDSTVNVSHLNSQKGLFRGSL